MRGGPAFMDETSRRARARTAARARRHLLSAAVALALPLGGLRLGSSFGQSNEGRTGGRTGQEQSLAVTRVGAVSDDFDKWTQERSRSISFGDDSATIRTYAGRRVHLRAWVTRNHAPPEGSPVPPGSVKLVAELVHAPDVPLEWATSRLEIPPTVEFRVFFDDTHHVVPGWIAVREESLTLADGREQRVVRESATILLYGSRFFDPAVDVRPAIAAAKTSLEFKLGQVAFQVTGPALEELRAGVTQVFEPPKPDSRPGAPATPPDDASKPQPPAPKNGPDSRPAGG